MFDHVGINVRDFRRSRAVAFILDDRETVHAFYDAPR